MAKSANINSAESRLACLTGRCPSCAILITASKQNVPHSQLHVHQAKQESAYFSKKSTCSGNPKAS